ncbi:hypothetical protein GCM10009584_13470 [Ornithinimicrobium humiphilum]|uniref:ABC-type transport system involved in multi-copper enzyme maturation permease subunit n=1 Tax=Ornithinimicrobium humiphilum TaxID=125288 RepID=A0A543KK35_9MICO|nr:ABC transporter permease [Ornithinimicrobium humiphilum]TQM95442.1 ABC-type transport system involved in multi-copper enzyme maturation permease subunit [Ornithinimicrobium humiphilum]
MSTVAPPTRSTPEEPQMTTTTRDPRPELVDVGPVPFGRLLRTELRKLVDTRSGRWLLISIVAITAISMAGTLWVNRDTGAGLLPLLVAANIPQALLVPVLGVMTAANEWSQRTALITFTQEPRRLRVMVAKTLAAVLLGLGVLVVTSLLAAGAHVASMTAVDGGEVDLAIGWPMAFNVVVLQALGVLLGVAFGALFLNVPLGIVGYFLVPTLSPMIFLLTAWLREHAAWLDLATAQGPLLEPAWLTGREWAQVGTTSALWILLPLAVGCWRVVRREVK